MFLCRELLACQAKWMWLNVEIVVTYCCAVLPIIRTRRWSSPCRCSPGPARGLRRFSSCQVPSSYLPSHWLDRDNLKLVTTLHRIGPLMLVATKSRRRCHIRAAASKPGQQAARATSRNDDKPLMGRPPIDLTRSPDDLIQNKRLS